MKISCKETLFTYNVYHTVKAFFPEAEIEQRVDTGQEPLVKLDLDGGSCFCIMPADVRECAGTVEFVDATATCGRVELRECGSLGILAATRGRVELRERRRPFARRRPCRRKSAR